ncbi:MAG: AraC family transcriptional regulator [Sphingobacteriaceae bacterium]
MKPFIQKLPLSPDTSFVAKSFKTPDFEVSWHQHIEYELILFTEGDGMSFIGNFIGEFKTGDIFFLGSNLPHTFQKQRTDAIVSALVVQFKEDFLGKDFITLPESVVIKQIFNLANQGLKIKQEIKDELAAIMKQLECATGFKRIALLCSCLSLLEMSKAFQTLSTQQLSLLTNKSKDRIERVIKFTIDTFRKPITMDEVSKIAGLSKPAFCTYFKKSTKKTYISFLNEIRIGYACKLLMDSPLNITEICYDSGYNSLANFNKQFLKVKKITPSRYRYLVKKSE